MDLLSSVPPKRLLPPVRLATGAIQYCQPRGRLPFNILRALCGRFYAATCAHVSPRRLPSQLDARSLTRDEPAAPRRFGPRCTESPCHEVILGPHVQLAPHPARPVVTF